MTKTSESVPTAKELKDLFDETQDEHKEGGKNGGCTSCTHALAMIENPAIPLLIVELLEAFEKEPVTPFPTVFSRFFRAGQLWERKMATLYKDANELSRMFDLCDSRQDEKNK